jgi:hypothetical protein
MANGKYAKRDQRAADLARQFEETKRKGEEDRRRMAQVRCAGCKQKSKAGIYVEMMNGFVYCDACIEAAAKVVADNKAGR